MQAPLRIKLRGVKEEINITNLEAEQPNRTEHQFIGEQRLLDSIMSIPMDRQQIVVDLIVEHLIPPLTTGSNFEADVCRFTRIIDNRPNQLARNRAWYRQLREKDPEGVRESRKTQS